METTGTERRLPPIEVDEAAVSALLARANLLRLRRQWEDAIAACMDVLRQAPNSPTAHSLLGDIYEAQGRLEDALQWYAMAVDLNPTNSLDKEKLNRIVEQQRATLQPPLETDTSTPRLHKTTKPATERTMEWFDRYFPPGRYEGVARLIIVMSCGIALVLVIAAGFFFVEREDHRTAPQTELISPPPAPAPASPTATTSISGVSAPAATVTAETNHAPSMPSVHARAFSTEGNGHGISDFASAGIVSTPNDSGLYAALVHGLPHGLVARRAVLDAHAEVAEITVALSTSVGTETNVATSRERILRAATVGAHTVARAEPRLRQITVQITMADGTPLFSGETTGAIRDRDPVMETVATLSSLFTNPQWSRALPSDTGNHSGN